MKKNRTILKNDKFQKVTFFEKSWLFWKIIKILSFSKKLDFWKFWVIRKFSKKVTFWNFQFFKIFRKLFSSKKNIRFRIFFTFYFFIVSHVLPQQVASRNSHCAARGRGKRPGRKPENSDFWRFLGHFFLINHIGFSLKYVIPKSSTDFFHRKQKVFRKIYSFYFLIIFHPQSQKISLHNSFYTARYTKKYFFLP